MAGVEQSRIPAIQGNGGNGSNGELTGDEHLIIDLTNDSHRADLLRYALMVDAAYKTFDEMKKQQPGESSYETVLSRRLATNVNINGANNCRYVVTAHLYATIEPLPPSVVDSLPAVIGGLNRPYWFGYIAVDVGKQRDDCWDIVVVLRGSATVADLMMDIHVEHVEFQGVDGKPAGGKVAEGFHKVYRSKDVHKEHGKLSAQEQVVKEVKRLAKHLRDRENYSGQKQQRQRPLIRVTVTGHSLGGALALMAAHDAAVALHHKDQRFGFRAVTFGAPRVGDREFHKTLVDRRVRVFRVVVKQDIVPRLPVNNECDGDYNIELDDNDCSKSPRALIKAHSLDMYLHLILMTLPTSTDSATFKINESSTDQPPPVDGAADNKHKWINMVDEGGDGFMRLRDSDLDKELDNLYNSKL